MKKSDKIKLSILILCFVWVILSWLFSGGCTPYTKSDKIALGVFLSSQATDMYTTRLVMQAGGEECNPFFPKHPTDKELFIGKGVDTGFFLLLGELFPEHRKTIFGVGSCVRFGVSYHNYEESRK